MDVTQDEEDLPHVLVEVLGARHRHAQHVLDLREADDDGGGSGEADEHGVGQEVDEESQTPESQHQVNRADEQCEHGGGGEIRSGALVHDRRERGRRDERDDGHGPHRQLTRRSEQRVRNQRDG